MTKKTPRPQAAVKAGNIKNGPALDPFPNDGPVKQYEPLIRKTVGEYRERYSKFDYRDLLVEAVRLAHRSLKTFDSEKANFGTHLLHHLKGLNRYCQKQQKDQWRLVHGRNEDNEAEEKNRIAEDRGDVEFRTRKEEVDGASKEAAKLA